MGGRVGGRKSSRRARSLFNCDLIGVGNKEGTLIRGMFPLEVIPYGVCRQLYIIKYLEPGSPSAPLAGTAIYGTFRFLPRLKESLLFV